MNRGAASDNKYHYRRITTEIEPYYLQPRPERRPTKMISPRSQTRGSEWNGSYLRTVSKDDSTHFEPPIKKYRVEERDDEVRTFAIHKKARDSRSNRYNNRSPTMKSYKTIEGLILGAFENRDELVSSSLAAFWTRAACLLEDDNKSPLQSMHLNTELHHLFSRTKVTLEEFGSNNLSQTLTAMAKVVKGGRKGSHYQIVFYDLLVGNGVASKDSIFLKIADVAVHRLERYDSQALSTTAIAYARIGVVPTFEDGSNLFYSIAIQAMKRISQFNAQGLSTLVWAFATVKVTDIHLFRMVAKVAMITLSQFNPQNLSNLVWAFAKANQQSPSLFKSIANASVKLMSEYNSQNVSNTLWAFSHAREYDSALFEASAKRTICTVSEFNPQELANTVCAFAAAKVSNHTLFNTIGDEAVKKLKLFIPQNLSNIVWAFATAGVAHPRLFDRVAEEAIQCLSNFVPQELANTAWAYATAKEVEPKLFHMIAEESLTKLENFEPQHLSNIVWAYATLKLPHQRLFEAVANIVIVRSKEFSPQHISNLIWSYAFIPVGSVNKHLYSQLESRVIESIEYCDSQFLANIGWSYAVANVNVPSLFSAKSHFIHAIVSRQNEFNLEALCQIHQWILWRKELKADLTLSSAFQQLCYDSYIAREPSPSAFQGQVVSELKAIGFEPKEEYRLPDCGYILDALVEVNGEQVGIEVDGPCHFAGQEPLGRMTLKHRQVLNVEGVRVISIPYWEWDESINKKEYLRSKLDVADVEFDECQWAL
ncbi:hypothetical protein ACHAW6_010139 [Cyclotella cf. meneghiniana]